MSCRGDVDGNASLGLTQPDAGDLQGDFSSSSYAVLWTLLTHLCICTQIGSMAKPAIPSDISAEAGEFLQRTFEINHEARPSAADLLQGGWIVKGPSSGGGGGGNGCR